MAKRSNYLQWDEFFMATAMAAAGRSKDPCTQVGAVVVNKDRRVVGIGYNGMPSGTEDDFGLWGKGSPNPLHNKYLYVVHAEANALCNMYNRSAHDEYTMYVTLHPCNECAKLIVQSNVRKVVFANYPTSGDTLTASKFILENAGVEVEYYDGTRNVSLRIDANT